MRDMFRSTQYIFIGINVNFGCHYSKILFLLRDQARIVERLQDQPV